MKSYFQSDKISSITLVILSAIFISFSSFCAIYAGYSIKSSNQTNIILGGQEEHCNNNQNQNQKRNQKDNKVPAFNPNSKPLIVICLHTFPGTFGRIGKIQSAWESHPLIKDGTIVIVAVTAKEIQDGSKNKVKQVIVGCNEERMFTTCRFQRAYEEFLKEYPDVPWMFSADDDTWIDLDNLYNYLQNLMKIHNPMTELVFKGHANLEKTILYFLHGGCGWLISNGFLRFSIENNINLNDFLPYSRYRQPDTAQAIILRHIFKNIADWDEFAFQGFECKNCPIPGYITSQWESVPVCESEGESEGKGKTYGQLNKIVSFHTIGLKDNNFLIATNFKHAPDWVLYYRNNALQSMGICKPEKNDDFSKLNVSDYKLETLKKNEKIYKPEDVSLPLIDFKTYRDEHRPHD